MLFQVMKTQLIRVIFKLKLGFYMQKTEINKEKKDNAKRYLLKYIKELKVHFDLNDKEVNEVLLSTYYTKSSLYHIIKQLNNFLRKKR